MANTKISALPTYTGDTTGVYLVMDNSGLTQTYKVTKETLVGSPATYIMASNGSAQTIPNITQTTVSGWTNQTAINASEWNPTTGVFTATKAGVYLVTGNITYASATDVINTEYGMGVALNDAIVTNSRLFVQLNQTSSSYKQTNVGASIISVAVGDTITIKAAQFSGSNRTLHTNGNTITIQELPKGIVR
jgi:hypothetical protein